MSNKISNETKDRINKELQQIAGREKEQYVEAYLDNIEYPSYSWNEKYPYSSAEMWDEAEILGDNYPCVDTEVGRAYDDGTTLSYDAYGRRFTMHIRDDVDVHTFLQEIRLFMLGIGYHPECVDEYIEPE